MAAIGFRVRRSHGFFMHLSSSSKSDASKSGTSKSGASKSGSESKASGSPKITRSSAVAHYVGRFRWVICTVLLLGLMKNYMDRQVIGVLKTTLQQDLGWNEIDYGNLVFAFQGAYALGMIVVGRFIDRVGTRLGYAVAAAFWSLASIAHGMVHSLNGFLAARFALGLGESAVFPASMKAVAEWFPTKERALATGIFNAGSNLGAIATPLIIPWIAVHWGWRPAFFLLGGVGFAWLALWLWIYRRPQEHPSCSPAELEYICSDPVAPIVRISWFQLLAHRQTWAFVVAKFITDPVWWFYLFWVPDFFQREHGLALLNIGLPILGIYLISDAGSVAGGWLSSSLMHRGRTANASRKIAMLVCAVSVVPIVFAPRVASTWGAVLIIGLAAAAHQGFSCNLFTLVSDMFPGSVVASVVGIGGVAGTIGGMLIAKLVAYFLERTHSYVIPFFLAGSAYLIALAILHGIVPKLEPAELQVEEP
jgi:MFS transporter, ACS family, hexuronate transporter